MNKSETQLLHKYISYNKPTRALRVWLTGHEIFRFDRFMDHKTSIGAEIVGDSELGMMLKLAKRRRLDFKIKNK